MFKTFLVIIFSINLLYGDDISDLITQIQNADVSQKRLLINRLKLKLRDNNNQTREKTLKNLKIKHQHSYIHSHTHIDNISQHNHSVKHTNK